jgi:putative glutamine amidotransferase
MLDPRSDNTPAPSGFARPLVGITACCRWLSDMPYHVAGGKYVRAVSEGAHGVPLLIPALGRDLDIAQLVARLDGLLVTGSPSNVLPDHYGGEPSEPGTLHDPDRDATTLPLIRAALSAGLPVLGICRGLQELNVALGGTLHQRVHELPGKHDHRWKDEDPVEVQYAPAHPVQILEGGVLAQVIGIGEIVVNSLHWQGIDRLAAGLRVEAQAPDDLIEAVSVPTAPAFAVAVQWHPEWSFRNDPASRALLAAFGTAARSRAHLRRT